MAEKKLYNNTVRIGMNFKPLTVSEYFYLLIKIVYKYKKSNIIIKYVLRETYAFFFFFF